MKNFLKLILVLGLALSLLISCTPNTDEKKPDDPAVVQGGGKIELPPVSVG